MDRQFPDETVPVGLAAFPFERREVPIGEMNRVDRVCLGCGRREQGEVARQAIRTGPGSGPVAVGLGSQIGAEVLRPQVSPQRRGCPSDRVVSARTARAVSVAMGRIRVAPAAMPLAASNRCRCASSARMSALMTALGSMMP